MNILNEKFGQIPGGKVLDVGTGRGWFIDLLKDNLKEYDSIVGIDIQEKALEEARKKFEEDNISFIKMNAEKMNFEDGSFDTVAISNSLHHLKDHNEILNEIIRVLKPGGYLIIQEMFCDNQSEKQLSHVEIHHFQGELDTVQGICHKKTYRKEEIIEMIRNTGLEIVEVFEHNTHDEQKASENLQNEKDTIDYIVDIMKKHIEKIKTHEKYEYYKNRLNLLKDQMEKVGFFTATELIVIAKK